MVTEVCKRCGQIIRERKSDLEYTIDKVCKKCKRDLKKEKGIPLSQSQRKRLPGITIPDEWWPLVEKRAKKLGITLPQYVRRCISNDIQKPDTIKIGRGKRDA